uniref:RNase H type-1 domain-containing protein n=1 Tax=Quercus lobata TaxID=97700 RepID=A0A7N2N527_QUELO
MVIRDNNGLVLIDFYVQTTTTAIHTLEIRALAASIALESASDMGFCRPVLETDSLILANVMINDSTYLSSDGLLIN